MNTARTQSTTPLSHLPVAVIGGGPVGLTAAAHLVKYQQPFVVLEAGDEVGASVRHWGHVAMFSPWRYAVDPVARQLLEQQSWAAPEPDVLPTGHDLVDHYVSPLAAHPAIAPHVRLNARVTAVGRKDFDKVRTPGRDAQPFVLHLASGEVIEARAVIDASGTWTRPNPAASGGLPVPGEREFADRIAYGIPDVLGAERQRFAGKRVMVVGSGHSAFNVVLDLLTLAGQHPATSIVWVMRRVHLDRVWGGGAADALEARGRLGARAKQAYESGRLQLLTPFRIRAIAPTTGDALAVSGTLGDGAATVEIDELVVCTGFRPDLDMLREVRLGLDPWLESPSALGPLIDPNEHSCGSVRPHGARELAHPEKDFYVAGMKSYGRAPTFLLATGFEQVRSIVAKLSGDVVAADRVELNLPETGVCNTGSVAVSATSASAAAGCCGGPAPKGVSAGCVDNAQENATAESGCGCGAKAPQPLRTATPARA